MLFQGIRVRRGDAPSFILSKPIVRAGSLIICKGAEGALQLPQVRGKREEAGPAAEYNGSGHRIRLAETHLPGRVSRHVDCGRRSNFRFAGYSTATFGRGRYLLNGNVGKGGSGKLIGLSSKGSEHSSQLKLIRDSSQR